VTDDLADPRHPDALYDGVWSCACLFHVARDDLVTVLGRLAEATRSCGRIHASFKEGDGDVRSTSSTDPRLCYTDTLWGGDLRAQFAAAGWVVDESVPAATSRGSPYAGIDPEDRGVVER
jgi:hypothetical protein